MPVTTKSSKEQKRNSAVAHDEKFLQDHLKDVRAEMAWRRELEFRLLQLLLLIYPIIGGVMVQLFQKEVSANAFKITAILIAALVLAMFYFVMQRIEHEHKQYAKLGKQVLKIWLYFGLFEQGAYLKDQAFLPTELLDEKEGLGQGKGYKRTQALIVIITVIILSLLGALAFLKK